MTIVIKKKQKDGTETVQIPSKAKGITCVALAVGAVGLMWGSL